MKETFHMHILYIQKLQFVSNFPIESRNKRLLTNYYCPMESRNKRLLTAQSIGLQMLIASRK